MQFGCGELTRSAAPGSSDKAGYSEVTGYAGDACIRNRFRFPLWYDLPGFLALTAALERQHHQQA